MKTVTIYCDGSSLGNGHGEARAAAVALLNYRASWRAVARYLGNATNQQAEIAAATLGLEALREPCRVSVVTDSRYVVETMTGRFCKRTNRDWWRQLERATDAHEITWLWTRGHAGHPIQEAVDETARRIARAGRVEPELLQQLEERAQRVVQKGEI